MLNEEKLKSVMAAVLGIDAATIGPGTTTDTVKAWDSLKHMQLIIALEETFGIVVPDEEVATLTSYPLLKIVVTEQLANG
jgi:acyl carrier protein